MKHYSFYCSKCGASGSFETLNEMKQAKRNHYVFTSKTDAKSKVVTQVRGCELILGIDGIKRRPSLHKAWLAVSEETKVSRMTKAIKNFFTFGGRMKGKGGRNG